MDLVSLPRVTQRRWWIDKCVWGHNSLEIDVNINLRYEGVWHLEDACIIVKTVDNILKAK